VLCLIVIIVMYFVNGKISLETVKTQIFYNFYYSVPLSFVNGFLMDFLSEKYPWQIVPRKRAWTGFVGSIIVTMLTVIILTFFILGDASVLFSERNRMLYTIAFFITLIISSVLHARAFFTWGMEERVINEKLRKEKVEMELSALKAHIDPHFLFNSFNVLSGLIDENPKKAKKMLGKLSGIYRYILENRDEDTNTIGAELAFAKKYLAFQEARFEDSIFLKVDVDEAIIDQKLPALSLQLLLENAVKHNAFDEETPLHIEVFTENKHLVIRNNKRQRKNLAISNGMGLQNIKDRYQLLTKQDLIIEDENQFFTVKLPLIK